MCLAEKSAGPAVGEACDGRARKDRRAGLQGRRVMRIQSIIRRYEEKQNVTPPTCFAQFCPFEIFLMKIVSAEYFHET